MIRQSPHLLALGLAAALGGCMGTQNRGLESVHQPVVRRADYLLDLQTVGGRLAAGERARLAGWFDALRLGYGDRVSVEDPSSGPAVAEVAGVAAGYGLLLADGAPVTGAPVEPGVVRVVVGRAAAFVPNCPDHSRPTEFNRDNHTSSNFGCAVNGNLAAMVADPSDLVRGQAAAVAREPAVAAKAIRGHRDAPLTGSGGLKSESVGR